MSGTTTETEATRGFERLADRLGLACLIATVLLLSGVRIAPAEPPAEALMSVDPALTSPAAPAPSVGPAAPAPPAVAPEDWDRPGVPGVEIAPGIVVLNTRGFNYGPPLGEIDPAALRVETETRRAPEAQP